ncbi:MAG: hypothetical protein ACPHUF_16455 [Gammaproteobacteria bacterium]
MSPEDFEKLPESDQKRIQGDIEKVANLLQESMQTTLERSREVRKKILELDHEMTQYAVGSLIVNLRATYWNVTLSHIRNSSDEHPKWVRQ